MRTLAKAPNAESENVLCIRAPVVPVVDWRPIRGTLGAFRAGYEEIEQFVSELLDEIEAAWQEVDAERARVEAGRGAIIETPAGTSLAPITAHVDSLPGNEPLVRHIAELEEERYSLQAEVEFTRNQLAEQTKLLSDERRQAAEERATWVNELRLLREAIHRQMEAFSALPQVPEIGGGTCADGPPPASAASHAPNDPVLGPLLAQFKFLQAMPPDAAARLKKGLNNALF